MAWDSEKEEWYFPVVDVVGVLTEQQNLDGARNYWEVLKSRLLKEGGELVTNCNQLNMKSPKDGKHYKTDVANTEQLLRIIQSVPSKKPNRLSCGSPRLAKSASKKPSTRNKPSIVRWKRI